MASISVPRWQPYQMGMWLAHYWQEHCRLCQVNLSQPTRQTHVNTHLSHPSIPLSVKFRANLGRYLSNYDKGILCHECQQMFVNLPPEFVVYLSHQPLIIQAAAAYRPPVSDLLKAFKFNEDMSKLPVLVYLLRQLPKPKGCYAGNSVILPMPTTSDRLKTRGFDPVTILASHLSYHWQIPIWQGVARVDNTISQRHLSRSERLTNLDDAFVLTDTIPTKNILLFDDVATTGASLHALASILPSVPKNLHLSGFCLAHGL